MRQATVGEPDPDGAARPDAEARARFEALALPYLSDVYRLAVRLKGSAQDAEDLVQETYVKALKAFGTLRQPDRIRPWLFQILSRLVLDRQRSEGREVASGDLEELDRFSLYDLIWDEDPLPYSDNLHGDFLAQFTDEEVRAALMRLPEGFRVPLVLLYVEELSYKELAEIVGCPVGTIMSRLHRARKILERDLWDCAKRRGLVRSWDR
ncbi:MAG TPA: sigma-70 family RNA polymerase sigma factor [Candidatus Binatia bacterium]|nr:sigma-70 family RNA polymerase sigma factor [Candidatus Binatia bacterium]